MAPETWYRYACQHLAWHEEDVGERSEPDDNEDGWAKQHRDLELVEPPLQDLVDVVTSDDCGGECQNIHKESGVRNVTLQEKHA